MFAAMGVAGIPFARGAQASAVPAVAPRPVYLSPEHVAVDTARRLAYTTLGTANAVAVTNLETGATSRIALRQAPNEIYLTPDGKTLYVASGVENGLVEIFDAPAQKPVGAVAVGHTPSGVVCSADGRRLYVANRFNDNVAVVDLADGNKIIAHIPALREPRTLRLTPDGRTLAIANFLPHQAATDPAIAAAVTLADTATNKVRKHVNLDIGAQAVSGLAITPDGGVLYASYILSRFSAPITQLDRGWVNTAAISVIDLKKEELYATVLLDDPDDGAGNPGAIALANDGTPQGGKLFVAITGTHELITLDINGVRRLLDDYFSGKVKIPNVTKPDEISTSLSLTAPYKRRFRLSTLSPRGIAWMPGPASDPDGEGEILVAGKFTTTLERIAVSKNAARRFVSRKYTLGTDPAPDAIRRGELNFVNAEVCFQRWQSCESCHPEGRSDGLNWDQKNDGLGNPKNTKSLLYSHYTPPCMITGIRKDAELAVRRGIQHTLFTSQPESFAADIDEYLKSLRPSPSPWLPSYRKADPTGKKGPALFDKAGCSECHNGPYLTDMQMHNVGTGLYDPQGYNYKDTPFDTPTLIETWRNAPYLYDGRAVTVREVLTIHNKEDLHGITQKLTKEEIDLLALYVLTL